MLLSHDQRQFFQLEGFLILEKFFAFDEEIEPILRSIHRIIGIVAEQHVGRDNPKYSALSFDELYLPLIRESRALGAVIYDAVKQIAPFIRLVGSKKLEMVAQQLRNSDCIGVAGGGSGIRIDNPGERQFAAPWHQEYPAQLRSLDGLVFWSPLRNMFQELGPVVICPRSHRAGPLPVRRDNSDNRRGAYQLELADRDKLLPKYNQIAPLLNVGDLLVMDFLTLHRSGNNSSGVSRWSMQLRYFNFLEETGRKHGWKGSFANGTPFESVHPELLID